jgi:hypothetical protein
MGRRKGKGKPKKRAHPIELHASRVHTLARGVPLPKPYINKVRVRVCVHVCTCACVHVCKRGRCMCLCRRTWTQTMQKAIGEERDFIRNE